MIGASVGDGDIVRNTHVLDLNVLSANGARAFAIFLADVTVPNEAKYRFDAQLCCEPASRLSQDLLSIPCAVVPRRCAKLSRVWSVNIRVYAGLYPHSRGAADGRILGYFRDQTPESKSKGISDAQCSTFIGGGIQHDASG